MDIMHLRPKEAAARLQIAVGTLANWRVQGVGPCFIKFGKGIRYPINEIEKWENSRLRSNTAEV